MNAERRLAIGEGDVRGRLRSAFKPLRMLREEEVPIEMRSDFLWVMRQLTRLGPEVGPDGTMYKTAVDHTMSRIRNITGRKIAERIYKLNRGFS
jgi:hypothetical protein